MDGIVPVVFDRPRLSPILIFLINLIAKTFLMGIKLNNEKLNINRTIVNTVKMRTYLLQKHKYLIFKFILLNKCNKYV
jgi:hypothetical protein